MSVDDPAAPDEETAGRINRLVPSDLADDVMRALADLGGEAKRSDIIDRAVARGGWSADELVVRSHYAGAARTFHLRTCADYAVTICRDRGLIEPGAVRGHWRIAAATGDIAPHPYSRVFVAPVGVAGEPVGDDWRADEYAAAYGHLWFAAPSKQLSAGDHLFAIGVSRDRSVLGLFEVQSAGDLTEPANPWDPDRWPYAVAVRALAGVAPQEAVAVDGVTTPRATAVRITDDGARQALYVAMRGHAYAASPRTGGSATTSLVERTRAARRPRPFDPTRRPSPPRPADGATDPEETEARREKAQQGHHDLLARLHEHLQATDWQQLEEIPAAIDLRGVSPAGRPAIFEAKTITSGNETSQARGGLAQLLEYRQDYGLPDDDICLVVNALLSERRADLLERLGVGVLVCTDGVVRTQNDIARRLLEGD